MRLRCAESECACPGCLSTARKKKEETLLFFSSVKRVRQYRKGPQRKMEVAARTVVASGRLALGGGPLAAASRPRLRAPRQRGRVEWGERVDRPSGHSTVRVASSRPLKLSHSPLPRGPHAPCNGRLDLCERSTRPPRAVHWTSASGPLDLHERSTRPEERASRLESRPWRALVLRGRLRANGVFD